MTKWVLIAEHDRCFTIDGRHGEIDLSHFDSPIQLETLNSFQNMLYAGVKYDFMLDSKQQAAYKLTYRLDKLSGGFFK